MVRFGDLADVRVGRVAPYLLTRHAHDQLWCDQHQATNDEGGENWLRDQRLEDDN